ncbi:MAG: hypothetical protein JSS82_12610 [Bacteroidetes bacterium]|nr:hypothetical protein [Bacteroidota bacterium]
MRTLIGETDSGQTRNLTRLVMDVLIANKMIYVIGRDTRANHIMVRCEKMDDYLTIEGETSSFGPTVDVFEEPQDNNRWLDEALIFTPDKNRRDLLINDHHIMQKGPKVLGYIEAEPALNISNVNRVFAVYKNLDFCAIGTALMWLVKSSDINPLKLFNAMYTDDGFGDLLQALLPYSANATGEYESLDIFAAAYVINRFFMTNAIDSEIKHDHIIKHMDNLIVGLRLLLARSRAGGRARVEAVHDFVGRHDRFWVEDLTRWVDQEATLRTLESLRNRRNIFLSRLLYNEFAGVGDMGLYFDLKFNVIDLGELLYKIGMYTFHFPASAFIPSTGIPIGEIHRLTLLTDRPNYTSMLASSSVLMQNLCWLTRDYYALVMENRDKDLLLDDKHIYIRTREPAPSLFMVEEKQL